MAETHIISALTAKRSELAGRVAHHRKEISNSHYGANHLKW